jgi:hypothetical protein
MIEHIKNRTLFHFTTTKPYKQAFVKDQQVTIGKAYNPFFAFYENAREYGITDNGKIVQVKAVNWLTRVRDGTINTTPQILATIAAGVTNHYVMLVRELVMEEIRCGEFNSEPPSRQRCLYTCETLEEARYWSQRLGATGGICELICTGKTLRADARLLLADSEPLSVTRDRARKYWRGEASDQPEWETLFIGEARVACMIPT